MAIDSPAPECGRIYVTGFPSTFTSRSSAVRHEVLHEPILQIALLVLGGVLGVWTAELRIRC
jgi:hypothetical protein